MDRKDKTDQKNGVRTKLHLTEKRIWNQKLRLCTIGIGLVMLTAGTALAFFGGQLIKEQRTQTLFHYKVQAGMDYRVHLLPNELYEEEWMEPGRIYSAPLTDYIEVTAKSALVGAGEGEVNGTWRLRMILEGYQTNTAGRQVIYHKEFPLRAGTLSNQGQARPELSEVLAVDRSEYTHYVEKAESILGESTSKDLYLQLDGSYEITSGEKSDTKTFSSILPIPLGSSVFYEIGQSSPYSEDGALTAEESVYVQRSRILFLASGGAAVTGLVLALFTMFATRVPDSAEAWSSCMHTLLRKHGSRILCLENMPELGGLEPVHLRDMDALILLSEELHQPVFCSLDEAKLPRGGRFCVLGAGRAYLYERQRPESPVPPAEPGIPL